MDLQDWSKVHFSICRALLKVKFFVVSNVPCIKVESILFLQDVDFSSCSGKALVGELILLQLTFRCRKLRSLDISWSNVSDIGIQAFAENVEQCVNFVCFLGVPISFEVPPNFEHR